MQRYVTTFQDKIYLEIKTEISLLQMESVQFLPFYRYIKIFHFTIVPPVCFFSPSLLPCRFPVGAALQVPGWCSLPGAFMRWLSEPFTKTICLALAKL